MIAFVRSVMAASISVGSILNASMISLTPNPASETIIIRLPEYTTWDEICYYDQLGQQLYQQKIYDTQTDINVSNWQPGIYMAVIYADGKPVGRAKFVVQ